MVKIFWGKLIFYYRILDFVLRKYNYIGSKECFVMKLEINLWNRIIDSFSFLEFLVKG